ncbi:MAG TPA: hypothetical protein DCE41_34090 [Cytophagales bacterium]|nr:hypothetical protein [Cytophagales bacterium]HAA21574.1 hypothetical protein [Cytophagales bacterium]HAP59031.1 hypothetical protein [Cytophagales bacterium]
MGGNDLPTWVSKKERLGQIETFLVDEHLLVRVEAGGSGTIQLINFWRAPVREAAFSPQGVSMVEVNSLNPGLYWLEVSIGDKTMVRKLVKPSARGEICITEGKQKL